MLALVFGDDRRTLVEHSMDSRGFPCLLGWLNSLFSAATWACGQFYYGFTLLLPKMSNYFWQRMAAWTQLFYAGSLPSVRYLRPHHNATNHPSRPPDTPDKIAGPNSLRTPSLRNLSKRPLNLLRPIKVCRIQQYRRTRGSVEHRNWDCCSQSYGV